MSDSGRWQPLRRWFRPDVQAEVDAELEFHLEEAVRDLVARGRSPDEARAEALRRFGGLGAVRAQSLSIERGRVRRSRRIEALGDAWADLRFALRVLRRSPGFTLLAVACLGLGVGVTAAIASATHAILVRPLPFDRPDELVAVYAKVPARGIQGSNISYADYVDWRDRNRTFAALGMWTWWTLAFSDGEGDAERVDAAAITSNLFPLLGVRPLLGRLFGPAEERPGAERVVLLGHGLWNSRYGADSAIVGRAVTVDGLPRVVIGVMGPEFAFPDRGKAWLPFVPDSDERHGNRGYAGALGRLRPGASPGAAQADLDAIMAELERELPQENLGWRADVIPLRDDWVGSLRRPLQVFVGAVGCVLLIVCANIANLLLVRGAARQRELAVRTAIGAGRERLVRQLVVESLALASLGGAIGLGIAGLGIRFFALAFPNGLPFYIRLALDGTSLAITLGLTVLTGLVAGILPALRTTDLDLAGSFREGSAGAGRSRRAGRLRSALVVVEVGLSAMLVIGAALLFKSYRAYVTAPLGFDQRGLLAARITLPAARYQAPSSREAFYLGLFDRIAALPGVEVVGSANGIPFSGWNVQGEMSIEGRPPREPRDPLDVHFQAVSPDYFRAIGVPLLRGRGLALTDRDTANPVGVINDVLARREFGGDDPVGKRLRFGDASSSAPWITIVGVVGEFQHYQLPQRMGPAIYFPYFAEPARSQTLAIRTSLDDPLTLVPAVRAAVRQLDPEIPLYRVETFEQSISRSLWRQRLQSQVVGLFAALAMVLAAVGIYGVISYSVTQRTRELGIRAAIGASAGDLSRMVVRQGALLAAAGIGAGLAGALVASRWLESLLYRVAATDPPTFIGVPVGLGLVALAASWIPARRAARADPLVAMQAE
jgi:predicted permease